MQKTHQKLFLLICGMCLSCSATKAHANFWQLEGRVGAFFPESGRIREIFHTMPCVEIEGSYRFSPSWDAWAGVGCIFKNDKALGCGNSTHVQVIPFSLGIRPYLSLTPNMEFFVGAGGIWSIYHNTDKSDHVHKNITTNSFGGIFKSGFQFQVNDRITASLSAEYMLLRFFFHKTYENHFTYRNDVNMNGLQLFLGIGYQF